MSRLSPVSYIVLGLVELAGRATPYELKQLAAASVGNLWTVQHAQMYSEPERLAKAGYLIEEIEPAGRRRKTYELTDDGREALAEWRLAPADVGTELRDAGLLKLFFGADPQALAAQQLEGHRERLAAYEAMQGPVLTEGQRLALEAGIGHEREYVRFWSELAGE